MTPLQKLHKARAALVTGHPFFGSLALNLRLEERADISTCATDGICWFYNPDFVNECSVEELTGVGAHETAHLAGLHPFRIKGRKMGRWNIACDESINPILIDAGLKLPKGALRTREYRGLSAEEIYAKLPKGSGQGAGDDPGGCGGFMAPPSADGQGTASEAELTRLSEKWKVAVTCAANAARAAGKMPASLRQFVDQLNEAQIDWVEQLRRFFSAAAPSDYTWSRPNRRHAGRGVYLPSMKSERLTDVVIIQDTSMSLFSPAQQKVCASEVSAILEDVRPDKITLIYADAAVQGHEILTPDDLPLKLRPQGGGGTDFKPAFDWMEREGIIPTVCLYITDLEAYSFPKPPDFPLIWVVGNSRPMTAPFGEQVNIPRI
jgi:predicted metal-dependent peptidase